MLLCKIIENATELEIPENDGYLRILKKRNLALDFKKFMDFWLTSLCE